MVKDLFAIKGHKVSNGNPDFYEHATPATETAPVIERLLKSGASCTGITVCDEFFYKLSAIGCGVLHAASTSHLLQPLDTQVDK